MREVPLDGKRLIAPPTFSWQTAKWVWGELPGNIGNTWVRHAHVVASGSGPVNAL